MFVPMSVNEMLAEEAAYRRVGEQMRKEFNARLNSNFASNNPNIGDKTWDWITDKHYVLTETGWVTY